VTKIKLEVEIEVPDDHNYGVTEQRYGNRVILKDTVANMVRQNIWSLLNNAYCDKLSERIEIEGRKDTVSEDIYKALISCNEGDQDIWRQIIKNCHITVTSV
jgi:hypothetical protein